MAIRSRLPGSAPASTSHSVTLPGDVAAGDRLVVGFVNDQEYTLASTSSSGWSQIGTLGQGSTTNLRLTIFTKVATGSDALTVDLNQEVSGTGSNNQEAAWTSYCLVGSGGEVVGGAAAMAQGGGSPTTGDVSSVANPAAGDYDSIIFLGVDNNEGAGHALGTVPAGWGTPTSPGDNTAAVVIHSVDQTFTGTSSNFAPGSISWSGADQYVTGHAVFPAGEEATTETHRFFLTNAPAPLVPGGRVGGVFEAAHEDSISEPFHLGASPQGESDWRSGTEASLDAEYGVMLAQFVSDPATADGSVVGAYTLAIGRDTSDAASEMRTRWAIWVLSPEGAVVTGRFFTGESFATETPTGYRLSDDILEVPFSAGDRLVVEVGYEAMNTSDDPYTGTLYYGGTGSTVIEHEDSDVTRPKFLDLSITPGVTFEPPLETQRFYLTNADPSYRPWVAKGFWPDGTPGLANPRRLGSTPAGSPDSNQGSETSATDPAYVLLGQWISAPASGPGVVSGDEYALGVAFLESNSGGNFHPYLNVWVTEGDTNTRYGEVVNLINSDFEFSDGSPTGIGYSATGGSTASIEAGDRIVVELGFLANNISTTERTGTVYFGGTDSTDMSDGATDLDRPGWIEVQVTEGVTFDEPAAPGVPGTVFDLDRWHLTIPSDRGDGVADQIEQPELETYVSEFFYLDDQNQMVGVAPVQGATTSGESGATRTEFREREADYSESAWDPATTDLRQFTITTYADATNITGTGARKDMIIWQIHGDGGTPPLYVAAEWTDSSGEPLASPRVRVYGGEPSDPEGTPFRDNPITGLTPDTPITIRCRVEQGTVDLWVIEGQVADLDTEDPTYPSFQSSDFADVPNWYFKALTYNKQPIAVGVAGYSVAKISHFELIQPASTTTGALVATLPVPTASIAVRVIGPVTESGTLATVVAEVYSNRVNGNGDGTYDIPGSGAAADLADAFGQVMAGDYQAAAEIVDPYGYDVVEFADTATGRDHVFLRERITPSRFWGFYVWSLDPGRTNLVVEAPHPKADLYTHTEAAALFDKANARAFLLSTTHRLSSSVLDEDDNPASDLANYLGVNPFQEVHEVAAVSGTIAVQIHGFGNSTDPDYDIIVSEGQPDPSPRALALGQRLRETDGEFRVAVYDGVVGTALGATGNVQGQQSRAIGVYWVHIEQNSDVRSSATNRGQVEVVLALGIPEVVEGALDAGLPLPTADLAGTVTGRGALVGSLPLPTAALAGNATNPADLVGTLPVPTAATAGTVTAGGSLSGSLPLPTFSAAADGTTSGSLDGSLPLIVAALAATVTAPGLIAAVLPVATAALSGTVTADGDLAATLPLPRATILSGGLVTGAVSVDLPAPIASMSAEVLDTGVLAGSLPIAEVAFVAQVAAEGALSSLLPIPASSLAGDVVADGVLAATLPAPTAALGGDVDDTRSTLAAVLPAPAVELVAVIRASGELATVLPLPTAAIGTVEDGQPGPVLHAGPPVQLVGHHAGQPVQLIGLRAGAPTALGAGS